MTREELANKVYELLKKMSPVHKAGEIWKAIAETDDISLLSEYEDLLKEESYYGLGN